MSFINDLMDVYGDGPKAINRVFFDRIRGAYPFYNQYRTHAMQSGGFSSCWDLEHEYYHDEDDRSNSLTVVPSFEIV